MSAWRGVESWFAGLGRCWTSIRASIAASIASNTSIGTSIRKERAIGGPERTIGTSLTSGGTPVLPTFSLRSQTDPLEVVTSDQLNDPTVGEAADHVIGCRSGDGRRRRVGCVGLKP
jgi:hypothetical protein